MGIKHRTKVDNLTKLTTSLSSLKSRKVKVGASGEQDWLAGIHEYGLEIAVTPKMRAFLHSQGLHLSPTTTVIKIPERSFLRTGHDKNIDRVIKQTERAVGQVVAGKMSVDQMLDLCGEQLATAIKTYMRELSTPTNHPFTIERKGSSNPLIDTGGLLESITWETD